MAFGGFGAAKPAFPFGSSAAATSAAPTFGSFGSTATTSAAGFGTFGTANTGSAFGTPASTAPLFGGGGFGTTAAKPATAPLWFPRFGTGTFGSTSFGTSTSGFGAGTSAFGSAQPGTTAAGAFGTTPAFGTGSTLGGTSAFGTGGFGTGFGAKPAATGFGAFGTGIGAAPAFGQQQPQQQQQQVVAVAGPASAHEALVAAVFNCQVFGDERDQVLAKWNLLQAQWGRGKAYYSRTAQPLELTEQNPLCRFKAVGYSRLSGHQDKDGLVSLVFNKSEQEIKSNQQQLSASLSGLLGNKPTLAVHIDSVKPISENKTQVVMYIVEAVGGGAGSRVPASELAAFLGSPSPRAALSSAGCGPIAAVTRPTAQALQLYLKDSPPGMDIRLWKQAQADNPDPENYIPVPIIGFSEIKWRTRCQAEETALHAGFLRRASDELAELRTRRAAAAARLHHLAADLHRLRHTLLQVVCRQEMASRAGSALAPEEEAARARLHELAAQLAAPPLYNGRLNELLSAVRLQRSAAAGAATERYHLDPGAQEDMKQFLVLQQRSTAHLMQTARADLAALDTIAAGMARIVQGA